MENRIRKMHTLEISGKRRSGWIYRAEDRRGQFIEIVVEKKPDMYRPNRNAVVRAIYTEIRNSLILLSTCESRPPLMLKSIFEIPIKSPLIFREKKTGVGETPPPE